MASPVYQCRVSDDLRNAYMGKCAEIGGSTFHVEMTKKMMQAFVDGRLTIEPTEAEKDLMNPSTEGDE